MMTIKKVAITTIPLIVCSVSSYWLGWWVYREWSAEPIYTYLQERIAENKDFKDKYVNSLKQLVRQETELICDELALQRSALGFKQDIKVGDTVRSNRLYHMICNNRPTTGIVVQSLGFPSIDGYERVKLDDGSEWTTKYLEKVVVVSTVRVLYNPLVKCYQDHIISCSDPIVGVRVVNLKK